MIHQNNSLMLPVGTLIPLQIQLSGGPRGLLENVGGQPEMPDRSGIKSKAKHLRLGGKCQFSLFTSEMVLEDWQNRELSFGGRWEG